MLLYSPPVLTEPWVHERDHLQRAVYDGVGGLQDQSQHLPVQPAGGAEQFHRLLPSPGPEESRHETGQLHGVREPGQRPGAGHPAHQNHLHTATNVNAHDNYWWFYGSVVFSLIKN